MCVVRVPRCLATGPSGGLSPNRPQFTLNTHARTGYSFPYLYDATQETAKAYRAAATPEFFVFDAQLGLAYHGQFDDARPNSNKLPTGWLWGSCFVCGAVGRRGVEHTHMHTLILSGPSPRKHSCCCGHTRTNTPPHTHTGADLRTALDATLAGQPLPEGFKARPSIGA